MEYTEGQDPAARRPGELANPRPSRSEKSRQGARAATSGDTDEAQSDPTRHHPGTPLERHVVVVSTYSRSCSFSTGACGARQSAHPREQGWLQALPSPRARRRARLVAQRFHAVG